MRQDLIDLVCLEINAFRNDDGAFRNDDGPASTDWSFEGLRMMTVGGDALDPGPAATDQMRSAATASARGMALRDPSAVR